MTTILQTEPTHVVDGSIHPSSDEYHLTNNYVATLDASLEAASQGLRAIDPTAPLARRLCALGINDRAVWLEPLEPTGARERGFRLLWRFGPASDQTAMIAWQARLDEDGAGRTVLAITVRARGSHDHAERRIAAGWPIVETIAREHAKGVRRAIDASTDDAW